MPTPPTISVIIPIYNRAHLIMPAIESVLGQTYTDFELIVVDDASCDGLGEIIARIKDPRVRLVTHSRNKGAAAARNTGLADAKGAYAAFLDSDDEWRPEKLERQLEFMQSRSGKSRASCTGYEILTRYSLDGEIRISEGALGEEHFQHGCRVSPGSTLLAEKSLFDEIGVFREDLRRLEDWDWLLRYVRKHKLAIVPDALSLVDYRSTEGMNYDQVRSAVRIMKKEHFVSPGVVPTLARIRFLASLENELSAAAYKNRMYGRAMAHYLYSMLYYPLRSWDSVQRICFGILVDIFGRGRGTDAAGRK